MFLYPLVKLFHHVSVQPGYKSSQETVLISYFKEALDVLDRIAVSINTFLAEMRYMRCNDNNPINNHRSSSDIALIFQSVTITNSWFDLVDYISNSCHYACISVNRM